MTKQSPDESGLTGLEAAIVLIAFVVIAAVFGYVIINSGSITSQKSGQVVQAGIQQAEGTITLGGTVVAQADPLGTRLGSVDLYLENQYGSDGVNVDHISYTVSTSDSAHTLQPGNVTTEFLESGNGDRALDKGELVKVTLNTLGYSLKAGKKVTITVQPPTGNALVIERTLPASLAANKHYELVT